MFALLPLIGGVLLGRFAPRRIAVALQVLCYAVALTVLVLTAPDHGGSRADGLWIAPALAAVSAGTLYLGLRLAGRSAAGADSRR